MGSAQDTKMKNTGISGCRVKEHSLKSAGLPLTNFVILGKLLTFSLSLSFLICKIGIMTVLIHGRVSVGIQVYKVIKPSTVTNICRLANKVDSRMLKVCFASNKSILLLSFI